MITNDLLIVTMGISFYLIPAMLLIATVVFLWRGRHLIQDREGARGFARFVVRDPLLVSLVLFVGGFMMVSFLTGNLSLGEYLSVPRGALDVLGETLLEWEDPLSSESIALRGGVLIGVLCTVVVATTIVSYFRTRMRNLSAREKSTPRGSH